MNQVALWPDSACHDDALGTTCECTVCRLIKTVPLIMLCHYPMKNYAIGDGQKRITCPDRYVADRETDEITVFWDPEHIDMPIRASVITVGPKDKDEHDAAFFGVIKKAGENGVKPTVVGDKAIYGFKTLSKTGDDIVHFRDVGLGNHFCLFSVTVPTGKEGSAEFTRIEKDLADMITSLVERGGDEQFTCCLLQVELGRIEESVKSLLGSKADDEAWSVLQLAFDRSYQESDESAARKVGLVFGVLLRSEIPSLTWSVKIDDWGSSLALDLGESGIVIFPEDMILKRFDKREHLELKQFAADTIDMVEDMFRRYQTEK